MARRIVKIKLKGGFPLISFIDNEGKRKQTIEEKTEVHADFANAFAKLRPHLAFLTDSITTATAAAAADVKDEKIEGFFVSSYSIGGDEDDPGIVITGHKILKNKKALILNTPFTRFNEGEETRYKFADELMAEIEKIESEANQFLDNGKRKPEPQMSMFEDHDTSGPDFRVNSGDDAGSDQPAIPIVDHDLKDPAPLDPPPAGEAPTARQVAGRTTGKKTPPVKKTAPEKRTAPGGPVNRRSGSRKK